ncbi:MAG: OmpA family protein, partial [Bacteroidia bacterium]|nr:OmpA family protein [Bacteroidia bacterium]
VLANAFVALIDSDGNQLRKVETKAGGEFYFGLDCANNYTLEVTKDGFFNSTENIKTTNVNGLENDLTIFIEEKEFIDRNGREILNVESINFELNKSDIKEGSMRVLDKVIRLMKKYPNMEIEFGAHTDSRGGDEYNLRLSESRAQTTIEYLISKGVSFMKISGKGYGETELINNCSNGVNCSDYEHSLNKRTEFVVVKK